jgi:hypothetical protein
LGQSIISFNLPLMLHFHDEQYQPDWIAQRSQADEIARKI